MMTTYLMPLFTRRIDPVFDADYKVIGYDGFLDGVCRVFSAATMSAAETVLDELSDAQRVIEADLDAEADALASLTYNEIMALAGQSAAARDADVAALVAEIAADYTDLDGYADIGDEDAAATAVLLQPLLDRYGDAWNEWAARQWSAGLLNAER